ncbi:MAG: efflux RND transporter permease subunit [Clostridium sp.]|nr:efflux RND transporter permease subunit [Clostridium sp.]
MAVLTLIGIGLIPTLDTSVEPRPVQGRTLTISYSWPGAAAKVVEQNATSVIEGLVSSVRDVAATESQSRFGGGTVSVELKPESDVAAVRFEIASLIRQTGGKLPEGMSQPIVSGGETVGEEDRYRTVTLLTYQIADTLSTNALREYVHNRLEPRIRQIDGITGIEINGATDRYLEISYEPEAMARWGITSEHLRQAVALYLGEKSAVGEVDDCGHRMAVWLATDGMERELGQIPVKHSRDGTAIYLNNLARCSFKLKNPDRYYRINGLNTLYLNLKAEAGSNLISLSDRVQDEIESIGSGILSGPSMELTYDSAERQREELGKLVGRSAMSLLVLLLLVLIVSRSWRYLAVIAVTLAASLAVSEIGWCLFDIRLHFYSLAGITVSLGLVIDASIVMTDHYRRYRDRGAYFGIFAALLTTIGSLVLVSFMPDHIRKDLMDFALIVMINLTAALIVAYFFVPPLVEGIEKRGSTGNETTIRSEMKPYASYINWSRRHRWVVIAVMVLTFGLPIFALPDNWDFPGRNTLSKWLGGTVTLFAGNLEKGSGYEEKPEPRLLIRARLPQGGTAAQLNEKVVLLDQFLRSQAGIKRWVTSVDRYGAEIDVEFTPEALRSSLPYTVENRVIGRIIDIGGADWATSGVSEKGFSNALGLSYRSNSILLRGYNYGRLERLARALCDTLARNPRVSDIVVQSPDIYRRYEEDEFHAVFDRELTMSVDIEPRRIHSALRDLAGEQSVGTIDDGMERIEVVVSPATRDGFDLWRLENLYLRVDSTDLRAGAFLNIEKRKANNIINKRNQEYRLSVDFNVVGTYSYTSKYLRRTVGAFNSRLPAGFRAEVANYNHHEDTGSQYWLLGLVVIVIYFICGILFESWTRPLAILSLVPVAFIGVFVAFWLTGLAFGTGGFASLVLLAGLVVNSAIYILAEYDRINGGGEPSTANYILAFRRKIVPVLLTVVSTVAGLLPFLFDDPGEKFWFSFALGSIAGLIFSLIALVFCLPVFLRR